MVAEQLDEVLADREFIHLFPGTNATVALQILDETFDGSQVILQRMGRQLPFHLQGTDEGSVGKGKRWRIFHKIWRKILIGLDGMSIF
jgi:hypothetical protein